MLASSISFYFLSLATLHTHHHKSMLGAYPQCFATTSPILRSLSLAKTAGKRSRAYSSTAVTLLAMCSAWMNLLLGVLGCFGGLLDGPSAAARLIFLVHALMAPARIPDSHGTHTYIYKMNAPVVVHGRHGLVHVDGLVPRDLLRPVPPRAAAGTRQVEPREVGIAVVVFGGGRVCVGGFVGV